MGQNYNDNLDVHMKTNFEGFQNLLHITQKLVFHHQVVILNVNGHLFHGRGLHFLMIK